MTQTVYDTGMYKAVEKAGSVALLAEAIGVKRQAVYPWLVRGWAPPARAIQIEELYGIPRQDLMDPKLNEIISTSANEAAKAGRIQYAARAKPLW